MTSSIRQMRIVVETEDFEQALAFYRDTVGLPELESFEGDGGARVAILSVDSATLELANPAQVRMIDDVEVGRPVAHTFPLTVRIAFEVEDAAATADTLVAGGATLIAPPTETPWRSLNARLEAPGGMQITAFQELGPSGPPAARAE